MHNSTLMITFSVICLLSVSSGQTQYNPIDAFPGLATFSLPVEAVEPQDGTNRLFVVQQRGRIFAFEASSGVTTRKLFLDLSDRVSQSGGETGLLGLAFHPSYSKNGFFFVDYTSSVSGRLQSFVSRFQVSPTNPDSAIRGSELVLLTVDQPYENHNGGNLRFGPDGYLYIALGDGGSGGDPGNNAQNRSSLLGKILRIDVDGSSNGRNYGIPSGNPFARNTQGWREEIFAFGLRNPWKMSFDRATGTLWTGDVGQNLWEEIDTISVGGNYGWRTMEGNACYNPSVNCDTTGLKMPVWTYLHTQGNVSVTGGYVYRGKTLLGLQGKYIYADYGSGNVWALALSPSGPPVNQLLFRLPALVSALAEDRAGELYLVAYSGRIFRIQEKGTEAATERATAPDQITLHQNFPNPFNPSTTIRYNLRSREYVTLRIHNMFGQEIERIEEGLREAGEHSVRWSATAFPSGVYFYKLTTGRSVQTKSMLLLR